MAITISQNANINYLARLVKIDNLRKHPNADKLQITTIDGANVIVDLEQKIGDVMVFCPTEACLDPEFIRVNNLYEDASLNTDKEKRGYINSNGRVRAIRLRGESSRAFLLDPQALANWGCAIPNEVDREFDTVDGKLFIWKYIPPTNIRASSSMKKHKAKKDQFKRIIDSQFNFHIDTPHLARNLHKINPKSVIQVTAKLHGTSGIAANIIVNKKVGFFKRMLYKLLGESPVEYGYVASSRTVIRDEDKDKMGFYKKCDVWRYCLSVLQPFLAKGMTVYYEAVGYIPGTQTMIQKGYDYGCKPGECAIYIYRVTQTNPDGLVFEYSSQQVKAWCEQYGVSMVPEIYYGEASDFNQRLGDGKWNDGFLLEISNYHFMDRNDPMCKNTVPFEGVVVRNDNWKEIEVYKLKAESFYQHETKSLDAGDVGIDGR